MNMRKSLLLAAILGVASVSSWEMYWWLQGGGEQFIYFQF